MCSIAVYTALHLVPSGVRLVFWSVRSFARVIHAGATEYCAFPGVQGMVCLAADTEGGAV